MMMGTLSKISAVKTRSADPLSTEAEQLIQLPRGTPDDRIDKRVRSFAERNPNNCMPSNPQSSRGIGSMGNSDNKSEQRNVQQ